jgi:hypothetical protein
VSSANTETGVWVLTVEPDWGSRGCRRETEYFFRTEPTPQTVLELAEGHHYLLERKRCGFAYQTTSYH